MAKGVTVAQKPDTSEASEVEKASAAATEEAKTAAELKAQAEAEAERKAEEATLQGADDSLKGKKLYKLVRPYWNGRVKVEAGDYYYFEEGKAPYTAKLVEEPDSDESDDEE